MERKARFQRAREQPAGVGRSDTGVTTRRQVRREQGSRRRAEETQQREPILWARHTAFWTRLAHAQCMGGQTTPSRLAMQYAAPRRATRQLRLAPNDDDHLSSITSRPLWASLALFPGRSQILSRSRGEIFSAAAKYSCEIKSRSGLETKLGRT